MSQLKDNTSVNHKSTKSLVWGIACLVGPTVLILVTVATYAITNFIFATIPTPADSLIGTPCTNDPLAGVCAPENNLEEPPAKTIIHIFLFILGSFAVLTWIPGIIIGTILLVRRKQRAQD